MEESGGGLIWDMLLRFGLDDSVKNKKSPLTCKYPDALTLIQHAPVNRFLNILLLKGQLFCWLATIQFLWREIS
jgi:hypothetical protein